MDTNAPLSLDHPDVEDYVSDIDPQSVVASSGLKRLGQVLGRAVESGPAISKAPMEGVEPESDPFTDIAAGAIGAKLGSLGNKTGSILSKDFSILTAENPFAKTLSAEENQTLNTKFKLNLSLPKVL